RALVVSPPPASSLLATSVKALTAVPVYTPSSVSKLLPAVFSVTVRLAGAVQVTQTDAPPTLLAILGSPVSRVAPTLLPLNAKVPAACTVPLANRSFAGAAAGTF